MQIEIVSLILSCQSNNRKKNSYCNFSIPLCSMLGHPLHVLASLICFLLFHLLSILSCSCEKLGCLFFKNFFRHARLWDKFICFSHTNRMFLFKYEPPDWMTSLPSLALITSSILICPSSSIPCFWALPMHLWLYTKRKIVLSVTGYYTRCSKKAFWKKLIALQRKNHILL